MLSHEIPEQRGGRQLRDIFRNVFGSIRTSSTPAQLVKNLTQLKNEIYGQWGLSFTLPNASLDGEEHDIDIRDSEQGVDSYNHLTVKLAATGAFGATKEKGRSSGEDPSSRWLDTKWIVPVLVCAALLALGLLSWNKKTQGSTHTSPAEKEKKAPAEQPTYPPAYLSNRSLAYHFDCLLLRLQSPEQLAPRTATREDVEKTRRGLLSMFQEAEESSLKEYEFPDVQDAGFAVLALVDEVMSRQVMDSMISGAKWQSLATEEFSDPKAGVSFYDNVNSALKDQRHEVLHVYILCLALGFRGKYSNHPGQYNTFIRGLVAEHYEPYEKLNWSTAHVDNGGDQSIWRTLRPMVTAAALMVAGYTFFQLFFLLGL